MCTVLEPPCNQSQFEATFVIEMVAVAHGNRILYDARASKCRRVMCVGREESVDGYKHV